MNRFCAPGSRYSRGLAAGIGGTLNSLFLRTLLHVVFAFLSTHISAGPLEDADTAYQNEDYATVLRLLQPLAERGDVRAQNNLGALYAMGRGLPEDYTEAAKWYRKAAEKGLALAQVNLGQLYFVGRGVPKSHVEAVRWFRSAAVQGFADGQYHLAKSLAFGDGVPQSHLDAFKWYRKAAEQGHGSAQFSVGGAYERGIGVPQNFVFAHLWYNLASTADYSENFAEAREVMRKFPRKFRDEIEMKMTPRQLEQAQALAAEWSPKNVFGDTIVDDSAGNFLPFRNEVVSTGTGFFISRDGYLLTNHHVIEGCESVSLRLPGQSSRPANLVAQDPGNDLALLKSESRPDLVASLSSRKRLQLGQFAIIFGFPLTGVLSSSGNLVTGTVSALSGLQDDPRLFQISAPVQPGNSGGPVMDASGAVIGVVIGKLNARAMEKAIADIPQNVNFAIKGALAAGFLDSNNVDYVTDLGKQTIPVEEIAKRAIRFTVLVECLK